MPQGDGRPWLAPFFLHALSQLPYSDATDLLAFMQDTTIQETNILIYVLVVIGYLKDFQAIVSGSENKNNVLISSLLQLCGCVTKPQFNTNKFGK